MVLGRSSLFTNVASTDLPRVAESTSFKSYAGILIRFRRSRKNSPRHKPLQQPTSQAQSQPNYASALLIRVFHSVSLEWAVRLLAQLSDSRLPRSHEEEYSSRFPLVLIQAASFPFRRLGEGNQLRAMYRPRGRRRAHRQVQSDDIVGSTSLKSA